MTAAAQITGAGFTGLVSAAVQDLAQVKTVRRTADDALAVELKNGQSFTVMVIASTTERPVPQRRKS